MSDRIEATQFLPPERIRGIAGLRRALVAGETTARELAEQSLTAIAGSATTLNAFRSIRIEHALADADEADRRLAAGETAALLGIPVAIKDDIDIAGETTMFGCSGEFPVKDTDAEAVRRLRAAGAVVVGKTTTPELMQWPITESSANGATRNPWNLDHSPGGSSGGAAAAVAAGLVAAALGSDAAGSVRIPAAWTHLIGLKPQRGRISTWPHPDGCHGLTSLGPMTQSVADAAAMLDVLAGNHPLDRLRPPTNRHSFTTAAQRDPGRLRIAVSLRAPFSAHPSHLDTRIQAAVESLADTLSDLGHYVTAVEPAYGPLALSFLPRAMAGLRDLSRQVPDPNTLDPRTRAAARTGHLLGGPVLTAAQRIEPLLRHRIGKTFDEYDVVLNPTTAQPSPTVGALEGLTRWNTDRSVIAACPYTWAWNVTGWPAINIPAGILDGNLPIGASLLGPANSEGRLLSLAAQLEAVRQWQHIVAPLNRPSNDGIAATCPKEPDSESWGRRSSATTSSHAPPSRRGNTVKRGKRGDRRVTGGLSFNNLPILDSPIGSIRRVRKREARPAPRALENG